MVVQHPKWYQHVAAVLIMAVAAVGTIAAGVAIVLYLAGYIW